MSNPKELHENTRLDYKAYPFQLFRNEVHQAAAKDCVLYLHWHEHAEIILMREGRAVFHIDSAPHTLIAGEILMIPGGSLHVGYALDEGAVRFDCVVLNPSLFNDYMHDPVHAQYVAPFLEGRVRFPAKPADIDPACRNAYALVHEVIEELAHRPPAFQLIAKSKLHAFFALMARTFLPDQLAGKAEEAYFPGRELFKQLIRRIEARPCDRMSVEEAAAQVGLSPFHFCKMFKRLTGRTYVDYVNLLRMNEAQRMLREQRWTITEIASHVGCGNPNYFTKLYKQYKGMTPSQARSEAARNGR
ncbi:AraC family transcriptional regulator [Paenibacillus cisolokensis]|uniref:helix-turn-helix transcriptional regulator n=1 Tax=Paenibacillus cisolokensis TaxID=1658519 RepID=UPI003D2B0F6C